MSDSMLLELMDDAKRVAVYGRRSGRLMDVTLYDAIRKAEPITALDWKSDAVVALQAAVGEATHAIHPVTLIDLKGGWDPFGAPGRAGSAVSKAARYVFVTCAAVLIIFCAYYTTWQKEATALIDEVVALREEQQTALMNEIFVHLMDAATEAAPPLQTSSGLTRIAMREKIEQARHFDTRVGNQKAHINDIKARIWPTLLPAYDALASGTSGVLESLAVTKVSVASPVGVVAGIGQVPIDPAVLSLDKDYGQIGSSTEGCGGRPVVFVDKQDEASAAELARLRSAPENARNRIIVVAEDLSDVVGAVETIIRIQSEFAAISCTIGLSNFNWISFTIDPAFKTIKATSDFLGLWVLPALYGALGAIMFYMRSFLSPLFPNPAPERVLLRVAIGAFAGVAIAWFWSPAIGEMGGAEVTFTMLTLAFILGFSIDVFFALLDRLVATLTSSVGRIGTTA